MRHVPVFDRGFRRRRIRAFRRRNTGETDRRHSREFAHPGVLRIAVFVGCRRRRVNARSGPGFGSGVCVRRRSPARRNFRLARIPLPRLRIRNLPWRKGFCDGFARLGNVVRPLAPFVKRLDGESPVRFEIRVVERGRVVAFSRIRGYRPRRERRNILYGHFALRRDRGCGIRGRYRVPRRFYGNRMGSIGYRRPRNRVCPKIENRTHGVGRPAVGRLRRQARRGRQNRNAGPFVPVFTKGVKSRLGRGTRTARPSRVQDAYEFPYWRKRLADRLRRRRALRSENGRFGVFRSPNSEIFPGCRRPRKANRRNGASSLGNPLHPCRGRWGLERRRTRRIGHMNQQRRIVLCRPEIRRTLEKGAFRRVRRRCQRIEKTDVPHYGRGFANRSG